MSAQSVGSIGLDLVINKGEFDSQLKGIQSLAKKAGAVIAGAFAIKSLVDFGAQCIALGSDLAEVQNVVDVTFPGMSAQVNQFAQNAAASFGLSETMAKRFTGTFGAMAKAFGFNEQAAYEMSTTLTGLAGDVASFYNMSQDEAFTKLKSVFTGETESLKDLGVVMTQTALDQYALANGYGKTTAAMSEGEKVALRYKFVQEQLALASGDFSRTSGGWANQVRLLSLQFDSLKATIGQGLIAALTPAIQVLNLLMSKLMSAANAIKAFFGFLGGRGGTTAKAMTAGTDALAASAGQASKALGGTGGAAKKAAKDVKSVTTGIDELNIISQDDNSDGGGGGGGGAAGGGMEGTAFSTESLEQGTDAISDKMDGIFKRLNEIKGLFLEGFWDGFGDTSVFDSVKNNIDRIAQSLSDIFMSATVQGAFDNFVNKAAYAFGQVSGSAASVGMTVADFFTGSIANYLEQNTERIRNYVLSMLDIGAKKAELIGNFSEAAAEIIAVFRGDTFKQIGADIIGIFADAFMNISQVLAKFHQDLDELLLQPIIDNKDKIIETLNKLAEPVGQVIGDIKDIFDQFGDTCNRVYDTAIGPMMDSFTDGFSEIYGIVLDCFNTHILPVIQQAADKFTAFKDSTLEPLIDKFGDFAVKVFDAIRVIWEEALQPFIVWFIEMVAPIIAEQLQVAIDAFFNCLNSISEVIDGILQALSGLMDFIIGVFTGDWDRAWNGVKDIFKGVWTAMQAMQKVIIDSIVAVIKIALTNIQTFWTVVWNSIKKIFSDIWEGIKSLCSTIVENIKNTIHEKIEAIKTGIKTALDNIKAEWEKIWNGLKDKTIEIFGGIWNGIKGAINDILSGVEKMANGVIAGINKMIDALNSISFDIPDWVPEIGGETFGLNIPSLKPISIPKLAQGGFVKANTPTIAMIGDNRHAGEIVAPEDKMQAMVDRAVAMASQLGIGEQQLIVIAELLRRIIDLIEAMDLTVNIDVREIRQRLVELESRSGYRLRTT